ncbi:hypothetical protein ACQPXH_02500 [Nocardia sp. CA-135953]|uniref:hypothetical protein n=1 Tax=Nocardia sp. CA-135953 TaxID=3239978 RepID=UPI003D95E022
MSLIDRSMDRALRTVMLSEVQALLPGFISAASIERGGPINAASELLGLAEADLRRVLAVHVMLSAPVRTLVAELPTSIRRPLTASVRPRVAGRTVTSGIDWAATARHRATSSPLGDIWVTRPANRIFDIPENRALAWVLRAVEERGRIAVPPGRDAPGTWSEEIRTMTAVVHRARRTAWLEAIPSEWPGDEAYFRLRADRMGFYSLRVTEAARYLRRILLAPTAQDLTEVLSERYFEPRQDWKLFEIAVLMRMTRALRSIGSRLDTTRLFQDGKGRPFARFRLTHDREVRIWYQSWPPSTTPSELDDAVYYYELPSGGNRPDIVVEVVDGGISTQAILLELKASGSGSYLSSGLSQLLSYLRDRPTLLSTPGSGWLVAPPGTSFVSKPTAGRSLWVTTADDVAAELVASVQTPSSTAEIGTLPSHRTEGRAE